MLPRHVSPDKSRPPDLSNVPEGLQQLLLQSLYHFPLILFRLDPDGNFLLSRGSGLAALGLSDDEVVGQSAFTLFPAAREELQKALDGSQGYYEASGFTNGEPWHFANYLVHDARSGGVIGFALDVSDIRSAEHRLRENQARLQALSDAAFEGICLHERGIVCDVNRALCDLLQVTPSELIGRSIFDVVATRSRAEVVENIQANRQLSYRVWLVRKDGLEIPCDVRVRVTEFRDTHIRVVAVRDARPEEQAAILEADNRSLRKSRLTDVLTGVGSRQMFEDEFSEKIALAQKNRSELCLLVLDVDLFKHVNDTYGHAVGDHVLRRLGQLLKQLQRESDMVARFGGEEFAILATGANAEQALAVAERIRTRIASEDFSERRNENGNSPLHITLSIGVASVLDFSDPESVFRAADRALYLAKHGGRNCVVFDKNA